MTTNSQVIIGWDILIGWCENNKNSSEKLYQKIILFLRFLNKTLENIKSNKTFFISEQNWWLFIFYCIRKIKSFFYMSNLFIRCKRNDKQNATHAIWKVMGLWSLPLFSPFLFYMLQLFLLCFWAHLNFYTSLFWGVTTSSLHSMLCLLVFGFQVLT